MRLTTATLAALAAAPVAAAPVAAQPAPAARVDSIFAFATDSSPGCAVAAVRDGRTLYAQGYGVADLEHAAPITARTPFYLASVQRDLRRLEQVAADVVRWQRDEARVGSVR